METVLSYYRDHPGYYYYSPLFPDPIVCVRDMVMRGYVEVYDRLPWNGMKVWMQDTVDWIHFTACYDRWMFIWPLVIAVLLTVVRVVANGIFLKRIPVWLKFSEENAGKFPESSWKFVVYSITWFWALYLLTCGEENYFLDLKSHWRNWHPGEHVDAPLYWLYMFQMGFYLHSAYATIYIETIRKDFSVLMAHHIVTLLLLLFSIGTRFHKIGLVVLFVHDIGDILLELAKTIVYMKTRDGKDYYWPEMVANIIFAAFALQHILFRLYWFPFKAIYSSSVTSTYVYVFCAPYYLIFNFLLILLWMMQVYWFKFILVLAVKVFIKGEDTKDNRDYDNEVEGKGLKEKKEEGRKENNGGMEGGNGVRKRHSEKTEQDVANAVVDEVKKDL